MAYLSTFAMLSHVNRDLFKKRKCHAEYATCIHHPKTAANIPKRIEQLGVSYTSINTRLPGGPPIWITISPGLYHDAVYINNARLLPKQSNIIGTKSQSRGSPFTQILHKIDEVLVPTRSSATSRAQVFNPNAWEFLENYESLIQGTHRVRQEKNVH
ncbi:hypothetical protein D910_02429 [Dendroctonus ponderosae]|uniref:Uncharacterized protein n=1 Tax=Dendroctonus ponderosae TaxID=77166 RepID=U4U330_DENPD|nr:hypothetical protein D910_02429 [Dendroctonus ponderosae]